jgi:hypothetical protein
LKLKKNTHEHIEKIISLNIDIDKFYLFEFPNSNRLQDRIIDFSESEVDLIEESILYKAKNKIAFWEAFFTKCAENGQVEKRLYTHALHHNRNEINYEVCKDDLSQFINKNLNRDIALNSTVLLSTGQIMHIPMLDFKIPYSESATEVVKGVIRALDLHGAILASGRSYHFIGYNIIDYNSLHELLCKFMIFHPISDKYWAIHQLIEKSASLRVTNKYGFPPKLIEYV